MRGRMTSVCLTLAALLVCATPAFAQFDGAEPPPESLKVGFDTITADQANTWLSLLAGPKFEGRGTGQVGFTKAATWVAGKAAEFGLEPAGEGNTYFQFLPMTQMSVDADQSKLTGPGGLEIPVAGNMGFDRFTETPEIAGKVVFLTLKGEAPQLGEDIELRDKVVIYTADEAAARRASFMLGRQGPVAALQVTEDVPTNAPQLSRGGGRRGRGAASTGGKITKDAALKIVKAVGGEADWLDLSKTTEMVAAHPVDAEVKLEIRLREESAAAPNVVAWLPGSDPKVRDEFIVIGAHLDHLGMRGETMYPGADDNGSGSTAVLSIARAMCENPIKPKRSVLFMWFTGEEMGLLGSAHFTNNPTLPLEKMCCMFNIDMVGRDEEQQGETAEENRNTMHLIGSKRGDPALHEAIMEANKYVNFVFEYDQEDVFGRSDQANFYRKGSSVAFLFGGFHPDYHQPTDQPTKINYNKISSAARLYYVAIHLAAEHGKFASVDPNNPNNQ